MSASTCLSLSIVLSVDAFNDKILTYLNYHKVFYKNYNNNNNNNNDNNNNYNNNNKNNNNNNDNNNNNNTKESNNNNNNNSTDNNNNKRNVFGILQRKPQDIIVNSHVFVRNASW